MGVTVYTQPGCGQCEILKEWLKNEDIEFEEKLFDTQIQTEMIMMNSFDDPPFLRIGETMMSSGEIFGPDGAVIPSAIRRCIDG